MHGALAGDRYVVISADTHGGASMDIYRQYLAASLHDEFDAWRASFVVPFDDLRDTDSVEFRRNFDSAVRQADVEADGIAAEVIFPNTIPPFFTTYPFMGGDSGSSELYRRQWAGLQAHNRWLVDFCNELPGRRAGIAQVLLRDVDAAVEEIRWTREAGLFGGILLPVPVPGSDIPPLNAERYEPIWALCEELDVPVTVHGGGGAPDEDRHPGWGATMFLEAGWYATTTLHRLIFGGVFERHPGLRFAITETTGCWVPQTLGNLDWLWERMRTEGSSQARFGESARALPLPPSRYWARNCWQGASFMGRNESGNRHAIGVDRIMWGSDYPHYEGTFPFTRESLRRAFAGIDPHEVQQMLGTNAAAMYGFDVDALVAVARRIGPTVAEIDTPLDDHDIPLAASHTEALATPQRPVGRFC